MGNVILCVICENKIPDYTPDKGTSMCQECWDKYKDIEYEVEFKVIGTFLDQIYDCESEDAAIELAMDRLHIDPIRITDKDVDVIKVTRQEIVDHSKIRKELNKEILYESDK